jgi:MFS-type transporter involved in bile tolerance (Atg22 family)
MKIAGGSVMRIKRARRFLLAAMIFGGGLMACVSMAISLHLVPQLI